MAQFYEKINMTQGKSHPAGAVPPGETSTINAFLGGRAGDAALSLRDLPQVGKGNSLPCGFSIFGA